MTESIVPSIDMSALLGAPETNPEPKTPLENALATVDPDDAAADTMEAVKFQFRDLLDKKQLGDLQKVAPEISKKMVKDYNAIIQFGEPVLTELNNSSIQLLEAQRSIEVPEADAIVNGILRNMDGFEAKFSNAKVDNAFSGIVNFFKGAKYNIKAMIRESQPIIEKLNIAEKNLRQMELNLADNVTRGQQLHIDSNKSLTKTVGVLAALEEIMDAARAEYNVIDEAVQKAEKLSVDAGGSTLVTVEYKGKTVSFNEIKNLHSEYATGISEIEKTWFDWRQQFFLGYANAPETLNLILVSATMQRRCHVFRTMGIPQGRRAIAKWQLGAIAKKGAEMGTALQEGTNRLIQSGAKANGEAIAAVAMASQAPIITDETIFAILDGIRVGCDGLVAADKWGREMRAKSLQTMEASEKSINETFTTSRRALVAGAVAASKQDQALAPAIAPESDILARLGVA